MADFDEEATLRAAHNAFQQLALRAASGRASIAEIAAEGSALSASLRPPALQPGGFTIMSDRELGELPPLQYLVDGILPAGALGALVGAPGTGKSFCALDLCFCVATGTPWLGNEVLRQGPALLMAAEGAAGIRQRVEARKAATGSAGQAAEVFYLLEPVNLLLDEDCRDLEKALLRLPRPPVLIVIDTLHRSMAGGEENSARDMGRVIASIDRIRRLTGAAVLLIHHTVHDGGRERGSSSLRGGLDTLINLQLSRGRLRLSCGKQKDGSAFSPIEIRLVPMLGSCIVERAAAESQHSNDRIAGNEFSILASLDSLSRSSLRVSAPELLHESGVAESSFYRSLRDLKDAGYVLLAGRGKRSSVGLTESGKHALRSRKSHSTARDSEKLADPNSRESSPPIGGRRERNRPPVLQGEE